MRAETQDRLQKVSALRDKHRRVKNDCQRKRHREDADEERELCQITDSHYEKSGENHVKSSDAPSFLLSVEFPPRRAGVTLNKRFLVDRQFYPPVGSAGDSVHQGVVFGDAERDLFISAGFIVGFSPDAEVVADNRQRNSKARSRGSQ